MAATCVRAHALAHEGRKEAIDLADLFCREAQRRIDRLFNHLHGSDDGAMYRVAQQVLKGEHAWMEDNIMSMLGEQSAATSKNGPRTAVPEKREGEVPIA